MTANWALAHARAYPSHCVVIPMDAVTMCRSCQATPGRFQRLFDRSYVGTCKLLLDSRDSSLSLGVDAQALYLTVVSPPGAEYG